MPAAQRRVADSEPPRLRSRGREASERLLREAALRLLQRDGVLAGLRLQDVADEAGLSRGLINRYFESRQALLRSALDAKRRQVEEFIMQHRREAPHRSIRRMLQLEIKDPDYAKVLTLLAIDGDESFEPLAWLDEVLEDMQAEVTAGNVAPHDVEAFTALFNATVHAWAVFRTSFARQLGIPVKQLDERAEALLLRMSDAVLKL